MELKNKYEHLNVAITVCNTVKTTLGPRGMNKMVMSDKPICTNDGATIIKNLQINHPVGNMIKELAETQEKAIGDGTTTTTILCGQLLENAVYLLSKNIHPTIVISGYNLARHRALQFIRDKSEELSKGDKEKIMKTTFGSKIQPEFASHLTNLILDSDISKLKVVKYPNKPNNQTKIIDGFLFDGFTLNDRVPKEIEGKIALLDLKSNLEYAKFNITNTEELDKISERQINFMKEIVDQLKKLDVKAVFYTDTNPTFEGYLTEANIFGVVVYRRDFLDNIALTTNGTVIPNPRSNYESYLGYGKAEYIQEDQKIMVTSAQSKIKTLILCDATNHLTDEASRAIDDVISILKHLDRVVIGAGAFELDLAKYLKDEAEKIDGKEQIVVQKFAEAFEMLPIILAENCGFDAIEIVSIMKAQHKLGNNNFGIDPTNVLSDAKERGVLEPASLKVHAINSATDTANMIIKLDEIYAGDDKK